METDKEDANLDDLELVVETVDSQTVVVVTASFLIQNRKRLEAARVPVYLVTAKTGARFHVEPITLDQVSGLPEGGRKVQEFVLPRQWTETTPRYEERIPLPQEDAFSVRWNALMALSPAERVQELSTGREDFERKVKESSNLEERAQFIGEVTQLAFLVNRASMSHNKKTVTEEDRILVQETAAILQSVVGMVEENQQAKALFQSLHSTSTGQTLDHVARVFSTFASFLVYYNDEHRKGLNQRIRAVFTAGYREEYRRRLPELRETLATSDNLVRLPSLSSDQIRVYALGALMHDIGKILDLGYFENGADYDATRIKQHPIVGSGLFQRAYGEKFDEARFIVGDHHNYLFHPEGYGLSRWERSRGHRTLPQIDCCVADTLETFTSGQSLGFLPVEICTLADVYDALTDPSRQYKTPLSPDQTIVFMDEHFRAAHKIDPILFDLFVDFLRAMGVGVPDQMGLRAKHERQKAGKRA